MSIDVKSETTEDLVRLANTELKLADDCANEANRLDEESTDHRLVAARTIAELHRRIKADGLDFYQWAKGRIQRSRRDLQRLVRIGKASEPAVVAEKDRAAAREGMRKLRATNKADVSRKPEPQEDAFVEQFILGDVDHEEADDELTPDNAHVAAELRVSEAETMTKECLTFLPRLTKAKLKSMKPRIDATAAAWRAVAEAAADLADDQVEEARALH